MPKKILRFILLLLAGALAYGIYYCWTSFPILTGYSAKLMCSGLFVSQRTEDDISSKDLSEKLMQLATCKVDYTDSSVTASVWGMAKQKAIYRKGLGATLVSEYSEAEIRNQTFTIPVSSPINTDTIPWPLGNLVSDSVVAGVNYDVVGNICMGVMQETWENTPSNTYALMVVYKNQIIAEKYANGIDINTKLLGWSMAKSITATLIGIMTKANELNVQSPVGFKEWANDERRNITIENLLHQSSGLDFLEDYAKSSSVTNMLFRKADMGAYTATHLLKYKPGSFFSYTSGNTNMLCRLMRQKKGDDWFAFPYQALFHKIGMYYTLLEPDAAGTYVGSSYVYASARDYARFGLLYCNNGYAGGQQILPEGWLSAVSRPAPSDPQKHYGYQFWLNGYTDTSCTKRIYQEAPPDLICADGYKGQRIIIIPSQQLVVVRLGGNSWDEHKFLQQLFPALGIKS